MHTAESIENTKTLDKCCVFVARYQIQNRYIQ